MLMMEDGLALRMDVECRFSRQQPRRAAGQKRQHES